MGVALPAARRAGRWVVIVGSSSRNFQLPGLNTILSTSCQKRWRDAMTRQRTAAAWPAGRAPARRAAASSSSGEAGAAAAAAHPILHHVNEATKWVVTAVVFTGLVLRRDVHAAWYVLGAIAASFVNKALKYAINQQRPASARKADPGMPSSHANSLSFLSVYVAAALLLPQAAPLLPPSSAPQLLLTPLLPQHLAAAAQPLLPWAIVGVGVFLSTLRVLLGYHTAAQVVVGYALGAACALGWLQLGLNSALPAFAANGALRAALYGATLLAMAAFGVRNVLAWRKQHNSGHGGAPLGAAPA